MQYLNNIMPLDNIKCLFFSGNIGQKIWYLLACCCWRGLWFRSFVRNAKSNVHVFRWEFGCLCLEVLFVNRLMKTYLQTNKRQKDTAIRKLFTLINQYCVLPKQYISNLLLNSYSTQHNLFLKLVKK